MWCRAWWYRAETGRPGPPSTSAAGLAFSQALVLHHLADLPVHQVAREVGVPEGTIKARLSRGREALAALLSDDTNGGLQEGASHV